MRKYWRIATIGWQHFFVHRTNAWLEAIGNLLTMFVAMGLWSFAFRESGKITIGGYNAHEMLRYLLLAGLMTSLIWYTNQANTLSNEILDGTIANHFVKPFSFPLYYFTVTMAGKAVNLLLLLFIIPIILFTFKLTFSITPIHLVFFFMFFIIAILIQYLIFYIGAIFAFWFEEVWGILFLIRIFADIAAGAFLPLTLFAPFWQKFFDVLPFKYIIFIPMNALLGKLSIDTMKISLIYALAWMLGLLILAQFMTRRGVRHFSAVES